MNTKSHGINDELYFLKELMGVTNRKKAKVAYQLFITPDVGRNYSELGRRLNMSKQLCHQTFSKYFKEFEQEPAPEGAGERKQDDEAISNPSGR